MFSGCDALQKQKWLTQNFVYNADGHYLNIYLLDYTLINESRYFKLGDNREPN